MSYAITTYYFFTVFRDIFLIFIIQNLIDTIFCRFYSVSYFFSKGILLSFKYIDLAFLVVEFISEGLSEVLLSLHTTKYCLCVEALTVVSALSAHYC